jgi:hypothetical protein
VSEQQSEQTQAETGSTVTGTAASDVSAQASGEATTVALDQEATSPKADVPKPEAAKPEPPKPEVPKFEAVKAEAEPKPGSMQPAGKLMIMAPGERIFDADGPAANPANDEKKAAGSAKRRFAAMAAVVALATMLGAVGGTLASSGLARYAATPAPSPAKDAALDASIARIESDLQALKVSVEHTTKVGMSQFNKTSDRLDKLEKAQAEPAAKLAKLNDAIEKLRANSPAAAPAVTAAAQPAAAKEITGSIAPQGAAGAASAAAKPDIGRLPTVQGWALRDVGNGGALIESRRGIYEVYAGDPVPGLGRVDAIRKQDGRWVVVTSKGLIVSR